MTDAAGPIALRIDAAWASLSPQEQRVAGFLRARPDESALYNSAELARRTGVSKATVSRFFRRLGFADSTEARDQLRARRSAGVPVLVDSTGDLVAAQLAQDAENLRALGEGLDRAALRSAAEALAAARRIVVIGLRSGFPVAMQLRQSLAQMRDEVVLAPQPGQTLGEEVAGLTSQDAVVVVALRRRPAAVDALLDDLTASPAPVVLLAEPGALPAAAPRWRFAVPIASPSAFDSHVAATALVGALAQAVLVALGPDGEQRVAAADAAYRRLGELAG